MKLHPLVPALIALCTLAGFAQSPREGSPAVTINAMTAYDVAKVRTVTAAEISPDGRMIAVLTLVQRTAAEQNGRAHVELSVVPFEGGSPRVLVPAPGVVSAIQWAGDSQSVLFLSKRGDDKDARVWRVAAGGGDPVAVTPQGEGVIAFTASADGKRLAFTTQEPEDEARAKRKKAGFVHEIYEEEWRMVRVRQMDLGTGAIATLDLPGSAHEIEYNADGSRLCVAAAPTPSVDDSYMSKRVYAVDGAGSVAKAIDNPGKLGNATISPDGAMAAAVIGIDPHDPQESTLAVSYLGSGGTWRALTPSDYVGHVRQCVWLDAHRVLTLVHEGTEAGLTVVDARTGEAQKVLDCGTGGAIVRVSTSPTGRVALLASRAEHPQEAYAFDLNQPQKAPARVTDSNPWLKGVTLGRQEVVRWQSPNDCLWVEGVLIHPIVRPSAPAPLIVTVHGGPEAHDMNGWLSSYGAPGQVAAGQGYYVLYPNYRSSTGRGVAYSKLGQGDLANGEFTDILDGVRWLVRRGLVDARKVGITGGSYGGYLSAWAATRHSEHFAAAVTFVGVSNQISKRGCTDIPMEDYLVHWRLWTDENVRLVWDRSPVAHVLNARTPMLICHGKDDPRVHPSQSLELYRTMKNRGHAPVRLVWYPGEGHGNRNRTSRLDYALRTMQWFDHFLVKGRKDLPPGEIDYGEGLTEPGAASK